MRMWKFLRRRKKSVTDKNNDEIKYNYAKKSRVASDTCLEDSNKYLSPRQTIFFIYFISDYLYRRARVHFLDWYVDTWAFYTHTFFRHCVEIYDGLILRYNDRIQSF